MWQFFKEDPTIAELLQRVGLNGDSSEVDVGGADAGRVSILDPILHYRYNKAPDSLYKARQCPNYSASPWCFDEAFAGRRLR